jgi:hypothetical protein
VVAVEYNSLGTTRFWIYLFTLEDVG